MTNEELQDLTRKYLAGTISSEEREWLQAWYRAGTDEALELHLAARDAAEDETTLQAHLYEKIRTGLGAPVVRMRRRRLTVHWAAAAVVVVLIGGGTYFTLNRHAEKSPGIAVIHYKGDVEPGHNGAVLHLSNGSTVMLDSARNGTIARQGTVAAVKVNGALEYVGKPDAVVYNEITTGRGRQWQLTLPDGTKVWLNAASSIHYPLAFTGTEREVEITGEVYFEVMHNVKQPFRVKVGDQVIEDIGTAFNVNAYGDEPAITTTLVEGAVMIGGVKLKPGQQAAIANDRVKVAEVNVDQVLAWKNGLFSFEKADIYTVMRQLARWYDVDVKFEGVPDNTPFQGEIGRSLTLAQVLKGLEQIHVHFRIEEDKRIVILP